MHTVQLLLKTSKYERHEIDRRFHALAHLHNVCVKHARKCMIRLQHDKRYAELRQLYNELVKKEKMSKVALCFLLIFDIYPLNLKNCYYLVFKL